MIELPADESVIEGVSGGSDEASAPVDGGAKGLEVQSSIRREVVQPFERVLKLGNLLQRHHLAQNAPLANHLP